MPVTLCSYTYNDGRLLDGLLASLADWTTQPERLMLVDDGSHPAYVLPDLPLPTSLLRHPVNKGVAVAKKAGLDAATSLLVLSLDCDTRLDPDWLARCLPRMQDPKVALCGSTLRCNPGQDTVSQFMARFGDAAQAEAAGPADFVPGNVWLIKKAAWDAVQGFGPHSAAVGEDHALCGRLRDAGYTLFLEPAAVATQIRKLTRTAMARRFWSWAAPHYLRGLPDEPHFLTYAVLALVPDVVTRIEQSLLWSEPRFVYLHLLYLLHCLLNLATAGVVVFLTVYRVMESGGPRWMLLDPGAAFRRS
jgi:GT2 family glycosyltransferase